MVDMRFVVGCIVLLMHCCAALVVGNTSTVKCRENERLSLLSLKHVFGDPQGSLSSWGSAENQTDCCTWDHVYCDRRKSHVVSLDLSKCYLEGTISPSLAELHHLTDLYLDGNNFTPTQFPTFILSLTRLQNLYLSSTNLKGNIPLQLGYSLSHLQTLYLEGNQFEGGIPKSLALCSLTDLYLSNNTLSGPLDDFVASFSHCANISLQTLDLSYNRFIGSIPDLSQFSHLEYLHLKNNKLNGTLNEGVGLLSKLIVLDMSVNFLQGVISETHFLRLSQLEYLDLSLNGFTFEIIPDWIPPFQLVHIGLASCKLGPGFPIWLRTQKSLIEYLDISTAGISSTVPSWFWDLSFRNMNLSHNQIMGQIPNFKDQNLSFTSMDFSSNLFEGSIPLILSYKVEMSLDLSNNKFTDASTFLCPKGTVGLMVLDLSNNQIYGVFPDCWKYFESLIYLDVENNSFFGKLPTSMGSLTSINYLHLGFNNFSGEIPLSLNKCRELVTFDVAQNDFFGAIPSWIGDGLKKLSVLILRSNKFFGSLPPNICYLSQLQILDLSANNISGSLPKCLNHLSALANQSSYNATINYHFGIDGGFVPRKDDFALLVWKGKVSKYQSTVGLVKSVDLSNNKFMGEIPIELMDLVGLISLNISRNMLSGRIPATIGHLKSLDSLDMSRNHLSGHIPSQLSQIDRLSVMDLSYNNLSGEIPHGTQLQSFDSSTYEGNAHLCGAPLPNCPTSTRPKEDHSSDENSKEDEQFFTRGFFISLSLGFSTGFWGICSLIFLNKSFRYACFRLVNDIYDKVYVGVAINMAKLRRWRRSAST